MSRILFFLFGLPIVLVSMVGQFITDYFIDSTIISIINNGTEIVMTQEQQNDVKNIIIGLLDDSRNMPTIFVTTNDLAKQEMAKGYYVNIKFDGDISYNEYEFDELAFKVEKDLTYICFLRANDGVFEGRCLYFDLVDKNMSELYSYIENLSVVTETPVSKELQESEEVKEPAVVDSEVKEESAQKVDKSDDKVIEEDKVEEEKSVTTSTEDKKEETNGAEEKVDVEIITEETEKNIENNDKNI